MEFKCDPRLITGFLSPRIPYCVTKKWKAYDY